MPARLLSHHALSALKQMPRKFDRSSGSRFLLNNLIEAMADRDFDDAKVQAGTILDVVNAFVLGARLGDVDHDQSLRERQRREIMRYVDQHLPDPTLSVSHIAAVHRISKRYLHWLFRDHSVTVTNSLFSSVWKVATGSSPAKAVSILRWAKSHMPGVFPISRTSANDTAPSMENPPRKHASALLRTLWLRAESRAGP